MKLDKRFIQEHIVYAFSNAAIRTYPFPHFWIHDVFPADFYAEILANLPTEDYVSLLDQGKVFAIGELNQVYRRRKVIELSTPNLTISQEKLQIFWRCLRDILVDPYLIRNFIEKFNSSLVSRFGDGVSINVQPVIDLISDNTNFSLGPHTDQPKNVVVLLFYLARDNLNPQLGTSIYKPIEASFSCVGGPHYSFENFYKIATAPYLPNSCFAFFKNEKSFHGVERVVGDVISRDVIQMSIVENSKI